MSVCCTLSVSNFYTRTNLCSRCGWEGFPKFRLFCSRFPPLSFYPPSGHHNSFFCLTLSRCRPGGIRSFPNCIVVVRMKGKKDPCEISCRCRVDVFSFRCLGLGECIISICDMYILICVILPIGRAIFTYTSFDMIRTS